MSVLAKATFPFSGLNRSSGSGSIALFPSSGIKFQRYWRNSRNEGVDFFNGVFDFVVSVRRFYAQFED
jgi:hypothetical protein